MKLAFADPPYLGRSRYYQEHPDRAIWDKIETHGDLLTSLEDDYDGWAYCLSAASLPQILPLAPDNVRVAAWVKTFASLKPNQRVAYTWEPVLFHSAREKEDGVPFCRDHLAEPITLKRGLTGVKPDKFNRWILDLLGYVEGDIVDDLYPGAGGMAKTLAQGTLL